LLEICGDISDQDVIDSNFKLSLLPAILGKRSLDDHRKIVTARRSEINKEMERLPIRIDEVHRGLPDVTGIDRKASELDVQRLETALNDAKLRLQGVNTGGSIADLTKKLSGLNFDLHKAENEHRSGSMATLNRLNQQISEVEALVNASQRKYQTIGEEITQKDIQIKRLDPELSRFREKWGVIDAESFQDKTSDTCPACGQALPTERVQAAMGKALAAFNESKAERLGDIDRKGKELKCQKDRLASEIDALKKEREIVGLSLPETERKVKSLTEQRDSLKRSSEDFSGLQNRAELLDEIEDMEDQIRIERDGKVQDLEKIKIEISALQVDLSSAKAKIDLFIRREQGEKRIEELKAEEKKLAAEFEKLELEIYLMEQFIKTKVSMLTDRINAKFETVRFKLFNVLINGGIEDCCEITVNGIPFNAGLNNAARIQAGLDIIRTLQQHYGMKAPVFCDNRESVSEIPEMGCQVVSLVVSPEDKALRVEVSAKQKMAA
jgi:chromosome segregation ATPase